ncbi:hypothetical protein [Paraburkholderia sp. BL21I4N1]|uniref:hypothetical protein n=1 Tax=Paraburkholderia sp. BL21I4N1 TaxID=1938801 RepID=UPI000CFC041F|nr:hypothetical protein [Paraburkholderia sp. BL21I4N1]PQV51815.1 hypothetical protein B0G83_10422 [Paraburkholderia sp. BL21I4N1]
MSNLRFQIGDRVRTPKGDRGRIVAPAGFNGPDWWEIEPIDKFWLAPDGKRHGSRIRVAQIFATDSSLAPCDDFSPPKAATGEYYAVAPSGLVYGPAMSMDEAKSLIARRSNERDELVWHIFTEDELPEALARFDAELEERYQQRIEQNDREPVEKLGVS